MKAGTRVRIEMVGTVFGTPLSDGTVRVIPDGANPDLEFGWFLPERLSVIPEPLKVGDVIAEGTPELPVGTVLHQSATDYVWQHRSSGWLRTGDSSVRSWTNLINLLVGGGAVFTVLRVGGES